MSESQIFELEAHERYHKVVITSGKLRIVFELRISDLEESDNMMDATSVVGSKISSQKQISVIIQLCSKVYLP